MRKRRQSNNCINTLTRHSSFCRVCIFMINIWLEWVCASISRYLYLFSDSPACFLAFLFCLFLQFYGSHVLFISISIIYSHLSHTIFISECSHAHISFSYVEYEKEWENIRKGYTALLRAHRINNNVVPQPTSMLLAACVRRSLLFSVCLEVYVYMYVFSVLSFKYCKCE